MEEQKKSHVARNVIIAIVIVAIILGLFIVGIIGLIIGFKNIIKAADLENKTNTIVSEIKDEIIDPDNLKNVGGAVAEVVDVTEPTNDEPTKAESKTEPATDTSINIGGYSIASGTYIGYENMYDWEAQQSFQVEIKVTIAKDSIIYDGQKTTYTISGNQIIVNGIPVIQAAGTNRLQSMAQSMPYLEYQGY